MARTKIPTEAEIIEEAISILETQGWQKGSLGTTDGPVCARGALLLASTKGLKRRGWPRYPSRRREAAYDAERLVTRVNGMGFSLSTWNDEPTRRKSSVLSAFRRALKLAKKIEAS